MSRPDGRMRRATLAGGLSLLGLLAGCVEAQSRPGDAPGCEIAAVGGEVVTVRDAEIARALIQPPPARDEARRLAVAATLAYRRLHPGQPMGGMHARLTAYRASVREAPGGEQPTIEPRACWAGSPL